MKNYKNIKYYIVINVFRMKKILILRNKMQLMKEIQMGIMIMIVHKIFLLRKSSIQHLKVNHFS